MLQLAPRAIPRMVVTLRVPSRVNSCVLRVEARSRAVRARRRRTTASRPVLRWSLVAVSAISVVTLLTALLGLAFAGSPAKLAPGVTIAGVDVGGLSADEALRLLEGRSRELQDVPVVFASGSQRWPIRPSQLNAEVDWQSAVEGARREGEGFAPIRGLRRLQMRFFGADISPPVQVYEPALDYQLELLARAVDQPHREAALELRGLEPVVVPGQTGRLLDREAAASVIVRSLAGFSRAPVGLPVRRDPPTVAAADLAPVAARARVALSAPVRLALGPTRWRLPRWRIAQLLELPKDGAHTLEIAGPGADRYFARLGRVVNRAPVDADFAVTSSGIRIVPDKDGRVVDVPATAKAVLAAALSRTDRVATLVVATKEAERTAEDAKAMGITRLVGSFQTIYGGIPNRIHNVQLVSRLIDKSLIPPGATFSFNETTGERSAEKGFLEAPVIINGELQTALGGGVCQVPTTVFNAAYEAGLKVTARTNHALYISHYPLARDATVNYPDIDLRFVNDTGHWLLLRTFVGSSSLTVNLYGTPVDRRVESEATPLVVTGPAPVKRVSDPSLPVGTRIVEEAGSPARSTSVRRKVYDARGKLLYESVWYSYYRGEPRVVRVGTKPKPKQKAKPKPGSKQPAPDAQAEPFVPTPPATPILP